MWAEDEDLAADTVRCIVKQAPNLVSAQLLRMVHAKVAGSALGSIVDDLCRLEDLEILSLEIVGAEQLGLSELRALVPLVRKLSMKTFSIGGLDETQAGRLKADGHPSLCFETFF